MSEPQTTTQPQQTEAEQPTVPLDRVVAATERRQSITAEAAACLGVTPGKVCNLLRNVWKTSKGKDPLTDQEMFVGLSMIARFELDPIAREIYVTRTKNGLATIVGIDGWIKILDRTDHYDGFEQELIRDEKTGNVTCCVTTVYSTKRSHPARYDAFTEEYQRVSGFVAQAMPIHMLRIFSLRHAARLFVPLGGVTTAEEADAMGRVGEANVKPSLSQVIRETAERSAEEPVDPDPNVGLPAQVRTARPGTYGQCTDAGAAKGHAASTAPEDNVHDADPDAEQGDVIDLRMLDFEEAYKAAKTVGDIDALDAKAGSDPVVAAREYQQKILGKDGFSAKAKARLK